MDLGLAGTTALITGASQGIGEHVAETLAAEGVHLHLTARSADRLEEVRDRIETTSGVTVRVHPMDLTTEGAVDRLVETVGPVDLLVNNAGAIPSGDLWAVDEAACARGGT